MRAGFDRPCGARDDFGRQVSAGRCRRRGWSRRPGNLGGIAARSGRSRALISMRGGNRIDVAQGRPRSCRHGAPPPTRSSWTARLQAVQLAYCPAVVGPRNCGWNTVRRCPRAAESPVCPRPGSPARLSEGFRGFESPPRSRRPAVRPAPRRCRARRRRPGK